MALPMRKRAIPQCSACLRSYAWAAFAESASPISSSLRQQIRGKKKMPNNSATVTVKLSQDVKTFGKKGAIVPVERGRMRNRFFPQGIAEYVTVPEMKTLRLNGVPIERDFTFGVAEVAREREGANEPATSFNLSDKTAVPRAKRPELKVERVTPERSIELIDIFVRPHLDFYRQLTPEEKDEDDEPIPEEEKTRSASSAAADLLAARAHAARKTKSATPRGIYGSVSTHDVLVAVRAALAENDEAARVVFVEDDIEFVNLPAQGENESGRVKHVGDFPIEIRIKGAERTVQRTVRVIPQEA